MSPAALELGDIQGDILRAYGNAFDCTTYVFVTLGGGAREAARAWLGSLLDDVTTAAPWRDGKPDTTLNVALTAAGLRALGVRDEVVATFAPEFVDGMAARARLLGDVGLSDPARWEEGLDDDIGALVTINAQAPEQLEAAIAPLRAAIRRAAGVKIAAEQHAHLLQGAREHFGYADGFAQPAIMGSSEDKARGGGVPEPDGRWRALAPGVFVLG